MSDDHFSSSELRRRYHEGGSLPDDALSAAQLRARRGIAGNAKDFSTRENKSVNGMLVVAVGLVLIGLVAYFLLHK